MKDLKASPFDYIAKRKAEAERAFARSQGLARIADQFRTLWGSSFHQAIEDWQKRGDIGSLASYFLKLHEASKLHIGADCFERLFAFSIENYDSPEYGIHAAFIRVFLDAFESIEASGSAEPVLVTIPDVENLAHQVGYFVDLLKFGKPEAFCCRCDRRLWVTQFADGVCGHQDCNRRESNTNDFTDLAKTEKETPALDIESVDWIAALSKNKEVLKLTIGTLRKYRTQGEDGRTLPGNMFGIDRFGRIWRRTGTSTSTPYYLVSSLPETVD